MCCSFQKWILFCRTESDVRSSIAWTQHLDPIFANNLERDAALSWQYFGSSTGFLRRFPGTQWPHTAATDNQPINDFRIEDWFIQAASSPKDIVRKSNDDNNNKSQLNHTHCFVQFFSPTSVALQMILLDASGSMSGKSFALAIKTVNAILDTLSDNDFVNLIAFSDSTRSAVPCFKDKMVISCRHWNDWNEHDSSIETFNANLRPCAFHSLCVCVIGSCQRRQCKRNEGCHQSNKMRKCGQFYIRIRICIWNTPTGEFVRILFAHFFVVLFYVIDFRLLNFIVQSIFLFLSLAPHPYKMCTVQSIKSRKSM